MPDTWLYSSILGLSTQWHISDVDLDQNAHCLRLRIFVTNSEQFKCPVCGGIARRTGNDHGRWQHDDLLNMRFIISAVVPVTTCDKCGINRVSVPWEREGSRFRCLNQE